MRRMTPKVQMGVKLKPAKANGLRNESIFPSCRCQVNKGVHSPLASPVRVSAAVAGPCCKRHASIYHAAHESYAQRIMPSEEMEV
jgi:hypothetical protein